MKLTPLNITLACILVWVISEWNQEGDRIFSIGWLIVLLVVLGLLDLGFRLIFKDVKNLWFAQIGFILVVGILSVLIKLM
ncbi:hypothetical protein G5B00_16945 [Parapedobacter sp. SGR-10]|uniref:hypothetical protein n=1 Tax=Parapedobacter sp. SGR-10 TaxID=2710879 RepID=UPI0013D1070F|nr:hypothetical protein [Parapedobacter sp. SGR-10]NGF58200.1 hypothetical protein [Parapedobacter sp. SGR-10]